MKNYQVKIILSNDKEIKLALDSVSAPKSVEQFISLVKKNYYDGTIFHRIIDNFMIQTGGYKLSDNSLIELEKVEPIKGEFKSNGYNDNNIKHEVGVISMARTMDKNSATSQFFICAATCPWLDGEYAAFGKTIDKESEEVVLEVSKMPTCSPHPMFTDFPQEEISIKTILIEKEEEI